MHSNLIFLGHSANTQRLIDIASNHYDILGIVDDNYYNNTEYLDGLPIIGSEENIEYVLDQYPDTYFFVNSPLRNANNWNCLNSRRTKFIQIADDHRLKLINLIDPTAIIPETANLGKNIFVGAYTVFQNHVTIDDYAFIKEQVCIAHGGIIKKNVNLSSQCYIGANVVIGENSYIGIKGSVIASNGTLTIGSNCITHPGVIIMKDIPNNSTITIGGKIRGAFDATTIS